MPGYAEQGARALLVGPGTMLYNAPLMEVSYPLGHHRTLPIVVEQIVPSRVCFTCDVCCRFPERDSPLRPYFTREEIQAAIARGISPDAFPDHAGSKVAVVPDGEGYRCPALQAETGQCGIYEDRPLDCRLYPVAVMWDRDHADVVMGWDSKCPFIRDNLESAESRAYVERIAAFLESQEAVQVFISNQKLIGSFQDDVIVLRRLDRLTQGLRTASQLGLTVALVPEPSLRPLVSLSFHLAEPSSVRVDGTGGAPQPDRRRSGRQFPGAAAHRARSRRSG